MLSFCSTLGYIDQLGTAFSDDYACTGFGMHLAMPLIRANWRADMTEEGMWNSL